jgi:hypothetical protein
MIEDKTHYYCGEGRGRVVEDLYHIQKISGSILGHIS